MPERFTKLWQWYPHNKRGHKSRAISAWDSLAPDEDLWRAMGKALVRQSKTEEWKDGFGIPHLSTYLNGHYWEDWEDEEVRRDGRE